VPWRDLAAIEQEICEVEARISHCEWLIELLSGRMFEWADDMRSLGDSPTVVFAHAGLAESVPAITRRTTARYAVLRDSRG
jgi:hypothetical protein